ncbi:tRNA lysidine(34) synthetase TilS [Candidatus Saccharibacteria bacterium]|nr:tRNA lysidine(34) synthetase TilS [Candidatus Saccharibacteria bacterium]
MVLNKYVIAVSGGVDSVVLLDMIVTGRLKLVDGVWQQSEPKYQVQTTDSQFIVAHFDHGIREESGDDARFVEQLAEYHGLPFEKGSAELGFGASEDRARRERYFYLRQVCKKYNAPTIVTAHHQDDLVETVIINLIRGTGWRGLASLESTPVISRPLLGINKNDILSYAKRYNLQWVEDSTNINQLYLRNYIRHTVVPAAVKTDSEFSSKMSEIVTTMQNLKKEIDSEASAVLTQAHISEDYFVYSRHKLTMWPEVVAREVIYRTLISIDPDWHPTMQHIKKTLHFAKTAHVGKTLRVSKKLIIESKKRHVEFKKY